MSQWMVIDWIAARVPLIAHNIGISIGTMDYFDEEYIYFMQEMNKTYQFKWPAIISF